MLDISETILFPSNVNTIKNNLEISL